MITTKITASELIDQARRSAGRRLRTATEQAREDAAAYALMRYAHALQTHPEEVKNPAYVGRLIANGVQDYSRIHDGNRPNRKTPLPVCVSLDNILSLEGNHPVTFADVLVAPHDEMASIVECAALDDFLDCLTPREKKLAYLLANGYKYSDIAGILGIPAGTVRSAVARMRENARKLNETMQVIPA